MSAFAQKHSIRAQGRALAGKTDRLEQQVGSFIQGADRVFKHHDSRLTALEESVLALVQTVGLEEVQAAISEQRKINGEKRVADEAAALTEAVTEGWATPADAVAETSFIVGVESDKDGNLLGFGAQQCAYPQLPDAFKSLLLGKKVGDVVETPTAGKFELTGIYTIDEAKRTALLEAKKAEAPALPESEVQLDAATPEQTA